MNMNENLHHPIVNPDTEFDLHGSGEFSESDGKVIIGNNSMENIEISPDMKKKIEDVTAKKRDEIENEKDERRIEEIRKEKEKEIEDVTDAIFARLLNTERKIVSEFYATEKNTLPSSSYSVPEKKDEKSDFYDENFTPDSTPETSVSVDSPLSANENSPISNNPNFPTSPSSTSLSSLGNLPSLSFGKTLARNDDEKTVKKEMDDDLDDLYGFSDLSIVPATKSPPKKKIEKR
jgi:hypothetical protein